MEKTAKQIHSKTTKTANIPFGAVYHYIIYIGVWVTPPPPSPTPHTPRLLPGEVKHHTLFCILQYNFSKKFLKSAILQFFKFI